MEGRCQCGLIRFTTPSAEPTVIFVCHCTECRHQSSSAFGISATFPTFTIEAPPAQGPPLGVESISKYSRHTLTNRQLDCYFCARCGSRLMHKSEGEGTVSVKGGCLEGLNKEMMKKAVHIWTKEAIVEIPQGAKTFEVEPNE